MSSNAKIWLERFNKNRIAVDITLFIVFLAMGLYILSWLIPINSLMQAILNTLTTLGILLFAFSWLKLAEIASSLMKLQIEKFVELEKTPEEKAAPIIVAKKSISVATPTATTFTNKVIKTTKGILESETNFVQKRTRVKKKEG